MLLTYIHVNTYLICYALIYVVMCRLIINNISWRFSEIILQPRYFILNYPGIDTKKLYSALSLLGFLSLIWELEMTDMVELIRKSTNMINQLVASEKEHEITSKQFTRTIYPSRAVHIGNSLSRTFVGVFPFVCCCGGRCIKLN